MMECKNYPNCDTEYGALVEQLRAELATAKQQRDELVEAMDKSSLMLIEMKRVEAYKVLIGALAKVKT